MILGIIPARYASSRFPAKPLADLGGKSMIQRVYEQVKKSKLVADVVVATDHVEIFNHVNKFGGQVCMTKESHASGTDRCFEAEGLRTKRGESFDLARDTFKAVASAASPLEKSIQLSSWPLRRPFSVNLIPSVSMVTT